MTSLERSAIVNMHNTRMTSTDPNERDPLPIKWCITGPRKSGKTSLIRQVLSSSEFKTSFAEENIHIFSPTVATERAYDDLKHANKYNLVDYGVVRRIVDKQLLLLENSDPTGLPHVLIIFDDCGGVSPYNIGFVKALDEVLMGGKQLNISSITSFQSINQICGPIRTEFEQFLIFKPLDDSEAHDFLKRFTSEKDRDAKVAEMNEVWSKPYKFIRVYREWSVTRTNDSATKTTLTIS